MAKLGAHRSSQWLELGSSNNQHTLQSMSFSAAGEDFAAGDSDSRKPTAIILEPSKDLAEQTHDFMNRFKEYLTRPQLRCELLIGGTNPKQASRALQEGVDIITGTPGCF